MPPAARVSDPTSHGPPLMPGPGSLTVMIGFMPAWRALPAGAGAALESASQKMEQLMQKPSMTPADAAPLLGQISGDLVQAGADAAAEGNPAGVGAAAGGVAALNSTNAALTATWTTASAVPGGQPAANTAYTEGIKAAAATAASSLFAAVAGMADTHICPIPCPIPPHGPGVVTQGSASVLIDNLPAVRQNDEVVEACGGSDPIIMGCPTVEIGDETPSGGGGGGAAAAAADSSASDGGSGGEESATEQAAAEEEAPAEDAGAVAAAPPPPPPPPPPPAPPPEAIEPDEEPEEEPEEEDEGEPDIEVDPEDHDYGHVVVDTTHETTITIKNVGDADLEVGALALSGGQANKFAIRAGDETARTLGPEEEYTVHVSIESDVTGPVEATLEIPSNDADQPQVDVPLKARVSTKVIVVISVDWDGFDLRDDNIDAMTAFRQNADFSHIPLTHFLSAGYFSKSPAEDAWDIEEKMKGAMLDIDECGLHVHCYYSILKRALNLSGPQLNALKKPGWGHGGDEYYSRWKDGGHAKPLSDFADKEDVKKILRDSVTMLELNSFVISKSYRSGGWVMSDAIKQALIDTGFEIDSSAVPPNLSPDLTHLDKANLDSHWSAITTESQPAMLTADSGDQLKEIPDNCGMADYANTQKMTDVLNAAIAKSDSRNEPRLVQIGFHLETVAKIQLFNADGTVKQEWEPKFLEVIEQTLNNWKGDNDIWDNIEFLTVEQAAARFFG